MEENPKQPETGCCPRFNPEPYDEKEIVWKDKMFIKDHVFCLLHIPLNFGKVVVRNMSKIKDAGALKPDAIMLADECSLWGIELYIEVAKDVPDAEMVKFSGKYLTKVYEGPFKNAFKWHKDMDAFIKSKGVQAKKVYSYYTTCPKCAKIYGRNYVVMVAEI